MTMTARRNEPAFDENFDLEAVLQESSRFVDTLTHGIEQQRESVVRQAEQVAAAYWDAVKETREESGNAERGFYGLRVRRRGNSMEISWFRLQTFNTKEGRKTFPNSLTKGKGYRYPDRSFSGAKDWERSLIEETEDQCETLRRQWELLSRLSHSVREYRKELQRQE